MLFRSGVIDCTDNSFIVTLPTAANLVGDNAIFTIKNSGNGLITVNTLSSQTIDGELTQVLQPKNSITIMSNGSNYIII